MKRMVLILSRNLGSAGGSPLSPYCGGDRFLVSNLLRNMFALPRSQTAGEPPALPGYEYYEYSLNHNHCWTMEVMAAARLPRRADIGNRSNSCLRYHAIQVANVCRSRMVILVAAFVANRDSAYDNHCAGIMLAIMAWRTMVEPLSDAAFACSCLCRHVDGTTKSFRVDVQSASESCVCQSQ